MMQTEWFQIKKDPDAPGIADGGNFNRKNYPYFVDEKTFSKIDDAVAFYSGKIIECDVLFEPTLLIHDRLQQLFKFLDPDLEFKGVQLYEISRREKAAMPLYWLPFLPTSKIISEDSLILLGKAKKLVLDSKFLEEKIFAGKRILHCTLPAEDIWLLNLDAAECFLRRQPVGVLLEKISVK